MAMLIKTVPARMPSLHPNTNNWKIKLSPNSVGNIAKRFLLKKTTQSSSKMNKP